MKTPAYVGALKQIALTKETTRGTAEDHASGDWQRHMGFDFGPKTEVVVDDAGKGRIEGRNQSHIIHEWSEGSVPLYVTDENSVKINDLIFGQNASGAGTAGSPYVWTLANINEHTAFTVHVYDPVEGYLKYALGMADSIDLQFVHDDYIKATIGIKAGKEATGAGDAAYSTTEEIFRPSQLTVKIATNYAGLDAASAIAMASINLNVAKGAENFWSIGSTEPDNTINQRFNVSGDFETLYSDDTYRTLGLANTTRAIRIEANSGTKLIRLDLPLVDFTNWNDAESNDDFMNETIEFNADRDDTNGMIIGQVVNSV